MLQQQEATARDNLFSGYDLGVYYDEMFGSPGQPRPHYEEVFSALAALTTSEFEERRRLADLSFLLQGITFTVYSDGRGTERLFPFDLIPRVIPRSQWDRLEAGLSQRVMALNLFLQDVYGPQRILKDGKIPRSLVFSCQHYQRQMSGVQVPRGIYTHISGIDLVRDTKTGDYLVLEDNVRTPSGVSYVLENRLVMTRTFPKIFQACEILPIDQYPLEKCIVPGICLDLRHIPPRAEITPADLGTAVEKAGAPVPRGGTVLLCTGHHERTFPRKEYSTDNPGVNVAATEWLAKQGIVHFGIDSMRPGPDSDVNLLVHKACLDLDITHIESLCNLEALLGQGQFTFICLPLKWRNGTGRPFDTSGSGTYAIKESR